MRKGEKMPESFIELIQPYFQNEEYLQLAEFEHHNTTRLNHLYNVAVYSYVIGNYFNKKGKMDMASLITGALLHDFHYVHKNEYKIQHCRNRHGLIASVNATRVFHINAKEKNIIEAHMFPLVKIVPKSKEAWIVVFSDKFSAIMEACFNKNYVLPSFS